MSVLERAHCIVLQLRPYYTGEAVTVQLGMYVLIKRALIFFLCLQFLQFQYTIVATQNARDKVIVATLFCNSNFKERY